MFPPFLASISHSSTYVRWISLTFNLPVLSEVYNASSLFDPVGVVPVGQILAVVVPHTVEISQSTVSQFLYCVISGIERGHYLSTIFAANGVLHGAVVHRYNKLQDLV